MNRLDIGRLVVRGEKFAFEPARAPALDAKIGEDVEIALRYEYMEASPLEETLRLHMILDLAGAKPGSAEVEILDRPFADDSTKGSLVRIVTASRAGELKGTFVLEGSYAKKGWREAKRAVPSAFHASGTFTLRVR